MPDSKGGADVRALSAGELAGLTDHPRGFARCRMAGFLIREDKDAIYVMDEEGTWILPHDSYEAVREWRGGDTAPQHLLDAGRPVVIELREGGQIQELRPWTIRKGGDLVAANKRTKMLHEILTLDGEVGVPNTDQQLGQQRLAKLEEALGRRLGWNPDVPYDRQVFHDHHIQTASWNCGSDGGGG